MLLTGTVLGDRYEAIELIGSGGMADVYKAKDHKLNRFVAIKVLKKEYASDPGFVSKFRAEAQAAAGLMHPNIVNVYDVGEERGLYYFVMELVEGITLKHYIEKKIRLTIKEAVSIAVQVAMGIEAAHNNGIIHRDIKPQNIMISKEGKVKVADFGIAKAVSSDTITSHAMGSVHYTSPEQARGGYSDAKSDIYSIGITMFEMVTGHVPFDGETTVAIAIKHIQTEMPSPRIYVPDIPISVEQIIFKCTQKNPDRRYANTSELIADLKHSLMSPDEDFVVINNPASSEGTKTMSDADRTQIRQQSSVVSGQAYKDIIPNYDDNRAKGSQSQQGYSGKGEKIDDEDYNPFDVRSSSRRPHNDEYSRGPEDEYVQDRPPIKRSRQEYEDRSMDMRRDYYEEEDNPKKRKYRQLEPSYYEPEEYVDDDAVDPRMERTVTILMIIAAIVLTIVGVLVIRQVFGVFSEAREEKASMTSSSEISKVPNLVGKSIEEAGELLTQAGLTAGATKQESTEYDVDHVISQDVAPGTEVAPGTKIKLVVSSGKVVGVSVPDVVGKLEAEAKVALEAEGFTMQKQLQESMTVEKGLVISQSPLGATNAPSGSAITVVISSGTVTGETVTVPDLVGKDEATAKALLEDAGLAYSTVSEENNDSVAAGLVLSQTYAAGEQAAKGTTVNFTVSLGPVSYSYSCNMTVNAPAGYNPGTEAVIILMSDAGAEITRHSVTSFPYTVSQTGMKDIPAGFLTVTYQDTEGAWQTTNPTAVTFTKEN